MFYLLLITYYLFFLTLCLKNLKWAIYLIVFTLPAYLIRFEVFGLPMTVLEGEILVLFLVWLLYSLNHESTLRLRSGQVKTLKQDIKDRKLLFLYFYIFIFLCAATIAMLISPNFRAAVGLWKAYFIEPILFFIVFIKTLKPKDLKFVLMFLCFNVFMLSVFSVYQKLTGAFIPNEFWAAVTTRRVTSVFPYPNALALYLTPLIILFLGILVARFKIYDPSIWLRAGLRFKNFMGNWQLEIRNLLVTGYWLLVTVLGLMAIYFTKSKGALLGILAGIIFYAIFFKGYRKYFTILLVIIFIFLSFYIFINGLPNLQGSSTVTGGDSVSTRLEMWQETWIMLKTRPILGAGLAGYQSAVAPFHQRDYIEIYLYPHNVFLNFWSETGLLGLMAFLLIIGWFYQVGFLTMKQWSNETIGKKWFHCFIVSLLAGMTALLVHGLVDVPYFKNDLSVLFWLIIGMMCILSSNSQQSTINKKQ